MNFLKNITKNTMIIALAVGLGFVSLTFGKLGTAVAIGLTFFYSVKKGAIDNVLNAIGKSIGGGGVPPVDDDKD